jgi:hypothetical protein
MRTKIIIYCFLGVLLGVTSLNAGSSDRLGTAGAQELRIPVGSRATAMGGANVADVFGTEALFWNPAGVAYQEGTEAMFSHMKWLADVDVNYLGVATNLGEFGTLGFQAKVISYGEIIKTTVDRPLGTGETFEPTFAIVGATYSRIFTDRVAFGATANLVNQSVEQVSARGLAFDFGFTYDPLWQGLKFGLAVKNFGPQMKFGGEGFNVQNDVPGQEPGSEPKNFRSIPTEFELPAFVQLGLSWDAINRNLNRAVVTGSFQANNFSDDELRGGLEYSYDNTLFLRGGYMTSSQDNYMWGATLGAGITYDIGATEVAFDYAWMQTQWFDNTQFFTAKFSF